MRCQKIFLNTPIYRINCVTFSCTTLLYPPQGDQVFNQHLQPDQQLRHILSLRIFVTLLRHIHCIDRPGNEGEESRGDEGPLHAA